MIELKTARKIDAATAPELDKQLKQYLAEGEKELIVNMEDTIYISSVGLRVFVSVQKKIRAAKEGSMVLRHVSPQIMEIFEVTGFSSVLNFEE